jgi:uncharacterized membrane protein
LIASLTAIMKIAAALYLVLLPGWQLARLWLSNLSSDPLERLFVSILLGICITTLVGFGLLRMNASDLERDFLFVTLGLNALLLCGSHLRSRGLPGANKVAIGNAVALSLAAVVLGILPQTSPRSASGAKPFSEFYLVSPGTGPGLVTWAGQEPVLSIGITNHYPHANAYRIEAIAPEAGLLQTIRQTVAAGSSWQGRIRLPLSKMETTGSVSLRLFLGDGQKPVAELRLWQ